MAIKTVTRHSLNRVLTSQWNRLPRGMVLDIGTSQNYAPYKHHLPHYRHISLDSNAKFGPELCSDICVSGIRDNSIDTVLMLEVLEHILTPQKAVKECYRILKPGGVCLASTRFIMHYHPSPKDFFRFTRDSLDTLFEDFDTEIITHGNRFQAIWQLILSEDLDGRKPLFTRILRRFNHAVSRIPGVSERTPLGFVIYAKKN